MGSGLCKNEMLTIDDEFDQIKPELTADANNINVNILSGGMAI